MKKVFGGYGQGSDTINYAYVSAGTNDYNSTEILKVYPTNITFGNEPLAVWGDSNASAYDTYKLYRRNLVVNNLEWTVVSTTNATIPKFYAPESAGSNGQILQSDGTRVPKWANKSVTIAQISNLNSGWDNLLADTPSAYVTRWPKVSEVTGLENALDLKANVGQIMYIGSSALPINRAASALTLQDVSISGNAVKSGDLLRYATWGAAAFDMGTSDLGILIKLPFRVDSGKMFQFEVRLYAGYQVANILFSGYLYASSHAFHSPAVRMIAGSTSRNIIMGHDAQNNAYVWISGPTNYYGIAITNIVSGYNVGDWSDGWEISRSDGSEITTQDLAATVYPPVNQIGTGASGTWGINITGNAATATSATSATSASNSTKWDGYTISVSDTAPASGTSSTVITFVTE